MAAVRPRRQTARRDDDSFVGLLPDEEAAVIRAMRASLSDTHCSPKTNKKEKDSSCQSTVNEAIEDSSGSTVDIADMRTLQSIFARKRKYRKHRTKTTLNQDALKNNSNEKKRVGRPKGSLNKTTTRQAPLVCTLSISDTLTDHDISTLYERIQKSRGTGGSTLANGQSKNGLGKIKTEPFNHCASLKGLSNCRHSKLDVSPKCHPKNSRLGTQEQSVFYFTRNTSNETNISIEKSKCSRLSCSSNNLSNSTLKKHVKDRSKHSLNKKQSVRPRRIFSIPKFDIGKSKKNIPRKDPEKDVFCYTSEQTESSEDSDFEPPPSRCPKPVKKKKLKKESISSLLSQTDVMVCSSSSDFEVKEKKKCQRRAKSSSECGSPEASITVESPASTGSSYSAQRKFAQNSPNFSLNARVSHQHKMAPSQNGNLSLGSLSAECFPVGRPKTEDFLTFLCLRGTRDESKGNKFGIFKEPWTVPSETQTKPKLPPKRLFNPTK